MKTLTATIREPRELQTAGGERWLGSLTGILREILGLAVAIAVAAALVTLSVWLAGKPAGPLLAACTWGLGFVFLGLAVDCRGLRAVFLGITGLALPVLALLQDRVSPDFVIVSGVLLAAWAGHGILGRKSSQVA
jgi:hypothetical protein